MTRDEAKVEIEGLLFRGETSIIAENPSLILEAIFTGLEVFSSETFHSVEKNKYAPGEGDGYGQGYGFGGSLMVWEGYGYGDGEGQGRGIFVGAGESSGFYRVEDACKKKPFIRKIVGFWEDPSL